jgi:hypothetical protein
MSGELTRKREGRGEKITFQVSSETKIKFEEVQKALIGMGYVIDTDQTIQKIIRRWDAVTKSAARPGPNAVDQETDK